MKKKSFRPFPANKWAIQLPEKEKGEYHYRGDTFRDMTYVDGCALLETLGFERITDIQSFSFKGVRWQDKPRNFSMWWHRAGAFISMDSYEERINSIKMEMEMAMGYSRDRLDKSYTLQGSGGSYYNLDGTSCDDKYFSVGGNSGGLLSKLADIQSIAKLIPVEKWKRKNRSGIYIPLEDYFAFRPEEGDKELSEAALKEKYKDQIKAAQKKLIEESPQELRTLLENSLNEDRAHRNQNDRDVFILENALCLYRGFFRRAGIDWPTDEQSRFLSECSLAALGKRDVSADEEFASQTVKGLSVAHALLAMLYIEGNPDRLVSLIQNVKEETLRGWTSKPDASGNTLFSHALEWLGTYRHVVASDLSPQALPLDAVLDALVETTYRLGKGGVVISTKDTPALGQIIDLVSDEARTPLGSAPTQSGLLQLSKQVDFLEKANALGLTWFDPDSPADQDLLARLREYTEKWPDVGRVVSICDRQVLASGVQMAQSSPNPRKRF